MIGASWEDVRRHYAESWDADFSKVPEAEWRYFVAVDGPFTGDDWKKMPTLFKVLTR